MKYSNVFVAAIAACGSWLVLPSPALQAEEAAPTATTVATVASRWLLPVDNSDVAGDSSVVWGVLPNGLRYAVMPNNEPADKISLRLHVGVGSLAETEDELGLAHYLEHLAFNGSENFPPGNTD